MKPLRYFKITEFASPDAPYSGDQMQISTLGMLDEARHRAGVPFKITSAFRTKEYNEDLKARGYEAAPNSAHLGGWAVDIQATTHEDKRKLIKALYEVGFRRFGIMGSAIHVDNDPDKTSPAVWFYATTSEQDKKAFGHIVKISKL